MLGSDHIVLNNDQRMSCKQHCRRIYSINASPLQDEVAEKGMVNNKEVRKEVGCFDTGH